MNILSYPWRAMILCAAFVLYKYTLQVFPSAISHQLMSELSLDGLNSGHLSGSFLYALVITQLFVGYWLDRYSVVHVMAYAVGLSGIGAIGFSLSQTFYMMILFRALMGIGGAFAAAGYFKMTSLVVPKKYFAFVNGLLATALTSGIMLGRLSFSVLSHHMSWRGTLFGAGVLGCLLGLCFLTFLSKSTVLRAQQNTPVGWSDIVSILKNPQNWLLTLYNGFVFAPVGVFTGLWGISFLQQGCHLNAEVASVVSASIFIGFGIGSPCIGLLADRTESKKTLMLYSGFLGLSALMLLLYMTPVSPVYLSILLFTIGFSAGSVMLGFVLGKAVGDTRTEATLVTLRNTGGVAITAITEPLIGYLLDRRWNGEWLAEGVRSFSLPNYQYGLMVLPSYLVLALVLLYYVRETRTKPY